MFKYRFVRFPKKFSRQYKLKIFTAPGGRKR